MRVSFGCVLINIRHSAHGNSYYQVTTGSSDFYHLVDLINNSVKNRAFTQFLKKVELRASDSEQTSAVFTLLALIKLKP